ncbi:MAG: flagellar hook-length control protein FliK, partial [Pseudomonadota bacterium]
MNLDIMTLMAASAAASTPTSNGATPATPTGTAGVSGQDSAPSFEDILQSVTQELGAFPDAEAAPPTASALTGQTAPSPAATPLTSLNPDSGNPLLTSALASGNDLPAGGEPLPVTQADSIEATSLRQPTVAVTPEATTPRTIPASTIENTALTDTPGEVAPSAKTESTGTTAPGWYSQAATRSDAVASALSSRVALADDSLNRTAASDSGALASLQTDELRATTSTATRPTPAELNGLVREQFGSAIADISADATATEDVRSGFGDLSPVRTSRSSDATALRGSEGLTTPLSMQKPNWERAFSNQLTMLASRGIETAELKLDPPSLGSVNVRLSLEGDQAQLVVQSGNGVVRDLMESALPKLRELLASEGFSLD